jgi:hypothetical protein
MGALLRLMLVVGHGAVSDAESSNATGTCASCGYAAAPDAPTRYTTSSAGCDQGSRSAPTTTTRRSCRRRAATATAA